MKTSKATPNPNISGKYRVESESIKSNDNDILNWLSTAQSIPFILDCFIQFTCTNLDSSQKEGVTILVCFRKRRVPKKGVGLTQNRVVCNRGRKYSQIEMWLIFRNTVTKVITTQKKWKMIRITFTGKLNQKNYSKLIKKLLKTNQETKEQL